MKMLAALSLALAASLSSPARADAGTATPAFKTCPYTGVLADATEECVALRIAYRTYLSDCMTKMEITSRVRAHAGHMSSPQASRARFQICDKHARMMVASRTH